MKAAATWPRGDFNMIEKGQDHFRPLFSEINPLFASTGETPNVIRIRMRLRDEVDGDVLSRAVETAMKRYPYFCVELQKRDGQWGFADNPRPVTVTHSDGGAALNSEASNRHLIAFSWHEDWVILDISHALTDGTGAYEVVRTVLYYYHIALRIGTLSTAVLVAAMAILAAPLSSFFFQAGSSVWRLCRNMFSLGFMFFPINVIINLLMNGYKAQGRMTLVNVMSFVETAMTGVFAAMTVPCFGAIAAWLANTFSDLLALAILLVSAFMLKGRVSLKADDLLKLSDNFGADRDEFVELAATTMGDVTVISEAVIAFCKSRGVSEKNAFLTGLCVEELLRNVFQHSAIGTSRCNVNARVVCKGELTIRIQDDCRKFDPRERMNMYNPDSPEKNIGLRMVAKLASGIDYYNNAGINTLIIKI